MIADETTRLSTLVGDVLDTSRIEAERSATRSPRSISPTSAGLGRRRRPRQDEVSPHLEAAGQPAGRDRGRDALRQLVDNLISNAIKYSDSGGEVQVEAGR